ncbi:proline dehydrogenase, partial [Ascosphaera atra]
MAGKGTPRVTSILNQTRSFRPPQSSRRPLNNSPAWDPAGAGPSVQPFLDPKHVNRKQLKREMAKLPTTNLLRGLALLSVMGQPRLMDVATKIVKRNIKLLTTNPVLQALVDNLFYWQFCAGATPAEIQRTTHELRALGYKGVIAMYAREVDTSLAHAAKTSEEVTAQHQKLVSEWMEGSMKTIS